MVLQAAFEVLSKLLTAYNYRTRSQMKSTKEAQIGLPSDDFEAATAAVLNAAVLYITSYSRWQHFQQHALYYSADFFLAMVHNNLKLSTAEADEESWPQMHALFGYLVSFGKPQTKPFLQHEACLS